MSSSSSRSTGGGKHTVVESRWEHSTNQAKPSHHPTSQPGSQARPDSERVCVSVSRWVARWLPRWSVACSVALCRRSVGWVGGGSYRCPAPFPNTTFRLSQLHYTHGFFFLHMSAWLNDFFTCHEVSDHLSLSRFIIMGSLRIHQAFLFIFVFVFLLRVRLKFHGDYCHIFPIISRSISLTDFSRLHLHFSSI